MWKSVSCAVQGTGHMRSGTPCQDKTFVYEHNGVNVIALADGAGSAKLSHYGADRVVRDVARYVAEHFGEWMTNEDAHQVKQSILEAVRNGLLDESQALHCDMHDLASTVLLAAVDANNFILLHIGDGVIGYQDGEDLKVASVPDNGEFANETVFVTSGNALASMRLFKGELRNINAFVLMSDGTAQSLYQKQSNTLAKVMVKIIRYACLTSVETMERLLESAFESVISKNTQDDCSIAIIVRSSMTLCSVEAMSFEERMELYRITCNKTSITRRVKCFDDILSIAEEPCSLQQIARRIHLKPKHAWKRVEKLVEIGLLVKKGNQYQRP